MNNITTDAVEVYESFLQLNTKEMKKALKAGLQKGLQAVRNEARRNLKSWYPNTAKNSGKYDNSLIKDIRLSKIYEDDYVLSGKVLATSKRNKKSGSFRLKFFENGTSLRKTRKGLNRGKINGVHFIKNAADNMEGYFNNTMEDAFSKAVHKINETKWK